MIHNIFVIDAHDEIIVKKRFWIIGVDPKEMRDFAARVKESQEVLIEEIGPIKYVGKPLGQHVVVLCAETVDDDDTLHERVNLVTHEFGRVIRHEVAYETFLEKVDDYVTIALKVSVIGYGGVGKEDIIKLLCGGIPPTSYVPTVAIDINKLGGIRIGTYEVSAWDFAGQERFRKLWDLYFRGSRIILLVTDSTLENVLNSKDIVDQIRRKEQEDTYFRPEVLAIAYKQELPGALSPALVQRVLGVKTYPMNSIDPANPTNRQKSLDIIETALKRDAPNEVQKEAIGGPSPQEVPPSIQPPALATPKDARPRRTSKTRSPRRAPQQWRPDQGDKDMSVPQPLPRPPEPLERKTTKPHPDSIEPNEEKWVALFRSWLAEPPERKEQIQPSEILPDVFFIDARLPPAIETSFFVPLKWLPRGGVEYCIPSQRDKRASASARHELWRKLAAFVKSRRVRARDELWRNPRVQDFIWRVGKEQATRLLDVRAWLIDVNGLARVVETRLVAKSLYQNVVLLAARPTIEARSLGAAVEGIVSRLENDLRNRFRFEDFLAWMKEFLITELFPDL